MTIAKNINHLYTLYFYFFYFIPKIIIKNKYIRIEDYCLDDIEFIEPYISHGKIHMDMIA